MVDLLKTLQWGPKHCPECGAVNFRGVTYCSACGARIRNRNPIVQFLVTVLAVAIVIGVLWWKWKHP